MSNPIIKNPPKFIANYPNFGLHQLLSVRDRMNVSTSLTGRGITIAYLDAGFYMHSDLRERVNVHVDATTKNIKETQEITNVDVTSWHGLMVSAISAGDGSLSDGYYRGLASGSNLVLIKVSNPKLQVKEADILRGFKWLIDNHAKYDIRVLNVSVGGDRVTDNPDHPLHASVRQLVAEGVTVVISSGNHGSRRLVPPASSPEAIVVGGYDDHNTPHNSLWTAYHSNYGNAHDGTSKPDIVAPAEWIPSPILPDTFVEKEAKWLGALITDTTDNALTSLVKKGYKDLNLTRKDVKAGGAVLYEDLQNRIFAHKLINQHYQFVDGTSVAAPIVSATCALMLEANPALTPTQIRTILRDTAQPLHHMMPEQQGAGALQVDHAVEQASQST
ncbi:MAG: S8 family serine peptidase [Chloroflexota bacterium]